MKATGIVRRIDDLGRVVIPKEIRRTMRIREGELLDNSLTLLIGFVWRYIALHKEQQCGRNSTALLFSLHFQFLKKSFLLITSGL